MQRSVREKAESYMEQNHRRSIWYRIMCFLACVVVFCTTYALILPAITQEHAYCGLEEHTHGAECYAAETSYKIDCTAKTLGADTVIHTHTDACYIDGVLKCRLPEVTAHTHSESCYEVTKGHSHSEECYDADHNLICGQEEKKDEKILTCGKKEVILHSHTAECGSSCKLPVVIEHTHTEKCKTAVTTRTEELTCTRREHTHSDSCYSNRSADLEEAEDWEKTLPKQLCGEWREDILAVAKTQLGYKESTDNYEVTKDGKHKGYTRYGQWYGDKYGDWCAMFASFCLHYAGVDEEKLPQDANCQNWIETLQKEEYNLYHQASSDYEPQIGDLIFFEWGDGDADADHIGIIADLYEIEETEKTISGEKSQSEEGDTTSEEETVKITMIKTIEGNAGNQVCYREYELGTDKILGYAEIPAQEFSCGQKGHLHSSECKDEKGVLVCGLEEHVHEEECTRLPLTEEEQKEVDAVIAVIDALPKADEISEILSSYEEDSDEYNNYMISMSQKGADAYDAYQALSENQQKYVTNIDQLMEWSWLWSAEPLISQITSDTPTVVTSASTSDFVDLNLYDYGSNINTKYNSDNKYPGFQWNGGAYVKNGSTYNRHTIDFIDFGNSLITDLKYGTYSSANGQSASSSIVGNKGGAINQLDVSDYGTTNRPIGMSTGDAVLQRTLGTDGYPALTDGTSLSYLFSNGTYAKKQNSQSIDGLFQQDTTTGEYYYNSRWNHAQYSNNKFTLYDQIITPNFITYPFGNFLPFNDITNSATSTQVGKITSIGDYVQTVINQLSKDNSNGTKKQLIDMLAKYRDDLKKVATTGGTAWNTWSAKDAIVDYFTAGSGDHPSDDTSLITDALLNKMYNIDWDVETNFFFGMDMSMNFIQPKDGMTGNDTNKDGKSDYPMEFYFTGDDDVWVYIDGVLFLDLTGIHRHVGGKIDFVNGEVYYYALNTENGGDVNTKEPYQTYTFADILRAAGKSTDGLNENGTFKDYTTHSFKFYYMERGSGSSVCRLNFNFPLLKKNTISVEKELTVDDEKYLPLLGNPDFKFQILKADSNGNKTTESFVATGTKYTIYDAQDNKVGTGTVGANGVFTLKAGQRAEFSGIQENVGKYYVRELIDKSLFAQYGTVSIKGNTVTKNDKVVIGTDTFVGMDSPIKDVSDGSTKFHFENQVKTENLGSLEIKKVLNTAEAVSENKEFEFLVSLDGSVLPIGTKYTVTWPDQKTEIREIEKGGFISIPVGATAKIDKIIAGSSFKVEETQASAGGYTVTYTCNPNAQMTSNSGSSIEGVVLPNTSIQVTVTNSDGTSLSIPVTKQMTKTPTEGPKFAYKFKLQEVVRENEKWISKGEPKTLEIDLKKETTGAFTLVYHNKDAPEGTHYYQITEVSEVSDDNLLDRVKYDASVYIVEVSVTKQSDGGLKAKIESVKKDDQKLEGAPDLVFTNTLIQKLSISKQVVGSTESKNREYTFEVEVYSGDTKLSGTYPALKKDASQNETTMELQFVDGKTQIALKAGENILIKGLPYGYTWKVTETEISEFEIKYQIGTGAETTGNSAEGSLTEAGVVTFINYQKYELPESGGIGTMPYAIGGTALMLVPGILLLYKYFKRRKEDGGLF